MVKVKDSTPRHPDGSIDVEQWLVLLGKKGYFQDIALIRNACMLSQLAGAEHATETGESCLQQGLVMADILADLEVDQETLAAAIIFESVRFAELSHDDVVEQLGENIAHLISGVNKMGDMSNLCSLYDTNMNKAQIDNIRKMLLAMVDDVRVVLIKLAERLSVLRSSSPMTDRMRIQIATEVMQIYAPLANRLGIGAIKWEMEDLAFRYLHAEEYRDIAKSLKSKRLERDRFVNMIVDKLNHEMRSLGLEHFAVYGRAKHIHSIYRKMQRKKVPLEEIYDATAVRILVNTEEECYQVLGLVHTLWAQIPSEFDDYIVKAKPNGYQSLHTALKGPEERVFEIQIRTFQMHEQAEMGVAAHWKYKEGEGPQKGSHERKIEWLRDVLAWHREMAIGKGMSEVNVSEFLDDRVYAFTPDGDVLDLPLGVTALDFAYYIHSGVGHRCRGAKVNDVIVPLTYTLKTGDKVEILTGKEAKPSRDWMNANLNYLKTSRARAKVLHWFKMQDYDRNKVDGQEILERELKTLGITLERLQEVLPALHFKQLDDLFAAVGRGDVKVAQILSRLTPSEKEDQAPLKRAKSMKLAKGGRDLKIEGVGQLLSHMARCCQPVPGEPVIGYVTLGRGVSIHRQDCHNIIHVGEQQKHRFLQVNWGEVTREHYVVDIVVKAYDRSNLLRDVTSLLATEKLYVCDLRTNTDKAENLTYILFTVEIDSLTSLSRLLAKLGQVPNVLEARRQV